MTDAAELSSRQRTILRTIWSHGRRHGHPPTYREIERAAGLNSTGAVSYQVRELEQKGYLDRAEQVARGLRLTDRARALLADTGLAVREAAAFVRLPLLGDVRAGIPAIMGHDGATAEDADDFITVGRDALPRQLGELFALRVRGYSMIDALVSDGDTVIVQRTSDPRDGEMVVARLREEDELTLKRFYRQGEMVRLEPANPNFEPILARAANVEVQARVILIQRQVG